LIIVVEYGVGNIGALLNMFDYLGIEAQASSDPRIIASARKLILPGVGAFDKAMSNLRSHELVRPLNDAVQEREVPVLGICLGMHLMARQSEEGSELGLGWVDADVIRIEVPDSSGLKVPHVGWTTIEVSRETHLFDLSELQARFYFAHSYFLKCDAREDVAANIDYGGQLCCAVHAGNVYGVQFHPEKSHRFGMQLLEAFSAI